MRRLVLESELLRAEVVPDLGAGLADLSLRGPGGGWCPVLRRAAGEVGHFNDLACYVLAPWSNRIADAAFGFGGRRHTLRANWPDGTAIHGDVCQRPWAVAQRAPLSASLDIDLGDAQDRNWPWKICSGVRYELGRDSLTAWAWVRNSDTSPMPAGLGFHPYFNRVLFDIRDRVRVRVPKAKRYPARGMIPTGPPGDDEASRRLNEGGRLATGLDDVFECPPGWSADLHWDASGVRATVECSPECGHAVVYAPASPGGGEAPVFCLEPVTMVNDGFNALARGVPGTGVRVLSPGEQMSMRWSVRFAW